MKVTVKVVPKASRVRVKEEAGLLKVYLTSPAQDGKANDQLVEVLADHFKTRKYFVRISRGLASRTKTVEVELDK